MRVYAPHAGVMVSVAIILILAKLVQLVKAVPTKLVDLGFIPGIHVVDGEI